MARKVGPLPTSAEENSLCSHLSSTRSNPNHEKTSMTHSHCEICGNMSNSKGFSTTHVQKCNARSQLSLYCNYTCSQPCFRTQPFYPIRCNRGWLSVSRSLASHITCIYNTRYTHRSRDSVWRPEHTNHHQLHQQHQQHRALAHSAHGEDKKRLRGRLDYRRPSTRGSGWDG